MIKIKQLNRPLMMSLFAGLSLSLLLIMMPAATVAAESGGKFFGAKSTEMPAWFKDSFLDLNEDLADATSAGKRIMIFFYQHGCPYCNALVERNLAQKDIEQKVKKNLEVIAINMWGDREITHLDGKKYSEKTFSEKLKIQFTPTVIFLNEQGEVILRLNGYRSPQRFNIDLDYVVTHQETKVSYRDFVKANRPATRTSKKLNKEDFFGSAPYDFSAQRKNKSKPFAVFFEQKDCPTCDNLHNNVLPEKELRNIVKQFDVAQLDMWSKMPVITPDGKKLTAKQWAKTLNIKYAPSIIVFNEKGAEIIRIEAFFKVFHTQGVFKYVLDNSYKTEPSFQRYLNEYAEEIRQEGRDVDIWRNADEKVGAGG